MFNWNYSEEGIILYNYGLEGVHHDVVDGKYILKPEYVKNGFVDYRLAGMEYEPFGGKWLTDAFTQCLFSGKTVNDLDDASQSFYNGLAVVTQRISTPCPRCWPPRLIPSTPEPSPPAPGAA